MLTGKGGEVMSKFIARVNPKLFAAAMLYQGVRDVRHYLNGVAIQPHHEKGVYIVGTNGHVLIVIHDKDGYVDRDRIVSIEDKTMVRALAGKNNGQLFIAEKTCWLAAESFDDQPQAEPCFFTNPPKRYSKVDLIEGNFPNWQRVVPSQEAVSGSHPLPPISNKYLTLVGKTSYLISGKDCFAVHTYPQECQGSVVVFRLSGIDQENVLIAVMPMKEERHENVISFNILAAKALEKQRHEKAEAERKLEEERKAKPKPRMRLIDGEWHEVTA